jgi:hypothetical protein
MVLFMSKPITIKSIRPYASCLLFCGAKKQPSRSGELFGRYRLQD